MNRDNDTLYYDGRCPLCNAEMTRLAAHKPDHLALKDIHQLDLDDVTKHRMLKTLHLQTADGNFKVGIEANIAAWEETRWGWMWRLLRLPVLRFIAGLAYDTWAGKRYQRMYEPPFDRSSQGSPPRH